MPSFDDRACAFLGISQLKGVGFKTLREMGGVEAVADLFWEKGASAFVPHSTKDTPSGQQVLELGEQMAERLRLHNVQMIRTGDPLYPAAFNELNGGRPLWFFFRGEPALLSRRSVAVVGTRDPSETGRFLTRYAVASLVPTGVPVVSGLAKGVDELAHEWALTCSLPTISILGTGLLRTYPSSNADLADKIVASGGLLISEYLPDEGPKGENFVWRNRLQAALARCVLAPEWKRSSGTAHTIRYAKWLSRATVNLKVAGANLRPDTGLADHEFEVPTQHADFSRFLASQTESTQSSPTAEQTDLFGDLS